MLAIRANLRRARVTAYDPTIGVSGACVRTFLVVLFLFCTAAVGAGVGAYIWCSCELPAADVPALPLASVEPGAPTNADGSVNWPARTLIDLAAIRRLIWENTPVPLDEENPQYRQWAIDGFAEAEARAAKVTDLPGYFFALAAYVNGFRDPHFQFGLTGDSPPMQWPGFVVARHGNKAEVVLSVEAGIPVGAIVAACDGKPLQQLLQERIYPFRLNPQLADSQRVAMTRLFTHRGNPFAPPPAQCAFEQDGRAFQSALAWRSAPKDDDPWWKELQAAGTGPAAEWGLSEPAPGVFWIGVPTFSSGDETSAKLDALIREVSAAGAKMRAGRAIVIDTRGNGGGNSSWADKLAEAIFTADVLSRHQAPSREGAVDWRASPDNAAYWRAWSSQMVKEFGPLSINRGMAEFLAWQLSRSASSRPPMWRELGSSCHPARSGGLTQQRPKGGESPFPAKVYFLSNGSCGSSCLNFADRVLMVPGVKLIGSATSGDGAYMEVRSEVLPSKLAEFTFPQKVERGGGRGSLEAYQADVAYDGAWGDAAVRAWALSVAQR